jgi:biotin carboxylase
LKADDSWGGDGVVIARTREEARAAYCKLANPPSRLRSVARAARRRDAHFLLAALKPSATAVCVQRFVEGQPAASAFAAHRGEILGSLYYDVLVTHGTIGPPSVIRRVDCPEMAAATRAAAKCFGLSGVHGLDFIRDSSGAVHLIEINPRATQGGTLPFGAGRDLPAALASILSPDPVGMRRPIDKEIVVFFPREWQRNPASPYLKSGHHDVPWDDPAIMDAALLA